MEGLYSIIKPVMNAEVKIKAEGVMNSVLASGKTKQTITQESVEVGQEKKYTLDEAREILEPEFLKKANIAFESAKKDWMKVTEALIQEEREEVQGKVE